MSEHFSDVTSVLKDAAKQRASSPFIIFLLCAVSYHNYELILYLFSLEMGVMEKIEVIESNGYLGVWNVLVDPLLSAAGLFVLSIIIDTLAISLWGLREMFSTSLSNLMRDAIGGGYINYRERCDDYQNKYNETFAELNRMKSDKEKQDKEVQQYKDDVSSYKRMLLFFPDNQYALSDDERDLMRISKGRLLRAKRTKDGNFSSLANQLGALRVAVTDYRNDGDIAEIKMLPSSDVEDVFVAIKEAGYLVIERHSDEVVAEVSV